MKKTSTPKKALALLLCIIMAFSSLSLISTAAIEAYFFIERDNSTHVHAYSDWEIIQKSTCTEEGVRRRECVVPGCTVYFERPVAIDKNEHTFTQEWNVIEEASCTAAGKQSNTCADCGKIITKTIQREEHTLPNEKDVDKWTIVYPIHQVGRIQDGYKRANCELCGTTVIIDYPVPHTYSNNLSVINPATCKKTGTAQDVCTVCNIHVSIVLDIDPDAHTFQGAPIVETPATCHEEGTGVNKCTSCGEILDVTIPVDPDVHTKNGVISQWEVTKEVSGAHGDGLEVAQCDYCGQPSRTVFADHDLTDNDYRILSNPTCTIPGSKQAECKICKKMIVKEIPIDEEAHAWGTPEVLRDATCKDEGLQVSTCKFNYGHRLYQGIAKTEHVFTGDWEVITTPDCNTQGTERNYCAVCESYVERTLPIDADKHTVAQWEKIKDATCTAAGRQSGYCSDCQKTVYKDIPKHSQAQWGEVGRKEATCTKEGYINYVCKNCSAPITEIIPVTAGNHNYKYLAGAFEAPTCQEGGISINICNDCGEKVYAELPADSDAHFGADGQPAQWVIVKEPDGCTDGEAQLYCALCNKTYSKTVTATHNILHSTLKIDKNATCFEAGIKSAYCLGCYRTVEFEIPQHEWIWMKDVEKATCTQPGIRLYQCALDGSVYRYEGIPATGHDVVTEVAKYATCEAEGTQIQSCATCGVEIGTISTPAKHTLSSWVIQSEGEMQGASCDRVCTRFRSCLVEGCDYKEEDRNFILSHTYGEWEPESANFDCAKGGTLVRHCTKCNTKLGTWTVGKNQHAVTKVEELPAGAEFCKGTRETCAFCQKLIKETKAHHNNLVIERGYAATCTKDGLSHATMCFTCGYQTTQETIPAFGHDFSGYNENGNKVCTRCGDYKVSPDEGGALQPDYDGGCKCFCHDKGTIAKILLAIVTFFWKLFGINKQCDCGRVHY